MKMKLLISLTITAAIVSALVLVRPALSEKKQTFFKVKFVYDGDTIFLDNKEKVRYIGIDAPEINRQGDSEFMADEARGFNANFIKGARVRLEYDQEKRDRHGRLLAYVFLENGNMVNAMLVRRGMAHILLKRPNTKHKQLLIECQRNAMKKRWGIWSRPLNNEEKTYLGNRNSFRFHRPDCPFARKIWKGNLVKFKTCKRAFWEGYSPCKRCNPAQR